MANAYFHDTPFGKLYISDDGEKITGISTDAMSVSDKSAFKKTDLMCEAIKQLDEYFKGERKKFTLPLRTQGTDFQKKVWDALLEIPYGETRSYGHIAKMIKEPKAYRAVGGACNRNPIMIVIPCHRVIGCDSSLTGYAGGLEIKEKLLTLEKG
ncbi:MAG: methylated-DNA--[protein]-cysteine S-methyltransferase [Clostridia bacterium]